MACFRIQDHLAFRSFFTNGIYRGLRSMRMQAVIITAEMGLPNSAPKTFAR
jgi:hypothetical protein